MKKQLPTLNDTFNLISGFTHYFKYYTMSILVYIFIELKWYKTAKSIILQYKAIQDIKNQTWKLNGK